MKRVSRNVSATRELTDKELSAISCAVGRGVRAQTIAVASVVQANLKAEFAVRREQASKLLKPKKTVAV